MPVNINFDFIHQLEGKAVLKGYVPAVEESDSGVTIASGFDLGQRNRSDLIGLGLDDDLCDRLAPYCGLKKHDAVDKLSSDPLSISGDDAAAIDHAVRERHVSSLLSRFNAVSNTPFESLAAEQQTVIASVSFQYGVGLDTETPNFWNQITTGDWSGALANLRNFGDSYPTRRNKEADLLERALS